MSPLKLIIIILLGSIGVYLLSSDPITFLTMGLNDGIWDTEILRHGFPSIATGFCLIVAVSVLGIKIFE